MHRPVVTVKACSVIVQWFSLQSNQLKTQINEEEEMLSHEAGWSFLSTCFTARWSLITRTNARPYVTCVFTLRCLIDAIMVERINVFRLNSCVDSPRGACLMRASYAQGLFSVCICITDTYSTLAWRTVTPLLDIQRVKKLWLMEPKKCPDTLWVTTTFREPTEAWVSPSNSSCCRPDAGRICKWLQDLLHSSASDQQ